MKKTSSGKSGSTSGAISRLDGPYTVNKGLNVSIRRAVLTDLEVITNIYNLFDHPALFEFRG